MLDPDGEKECRPKRVESIGPPFKGWEFPRTFSMESSKGYWRRFVLPKIDTETGTSEYRGSLHKELASIGVSENAPKIPGDPAIPPNPKGKAKRRQMKKVSTVTAGNATTAARLYPSRKRLLKPCYNDGRSNAGRRSAVGAPQLRFIPRYHGVIILDN